MKFAIPTLEGKLCAHFGHCEKFAIIDVAEDKIVKVDYVTPPPHEPGVYPSWLKAQGVNVIISGGMGQRAVSLFETQNIKVIIGAQSDSPDTIVTQYLDGALQTGDNACDH